MAEHNPHIPEYKLTMRDAPEHGMFAIRAWMNFSNDREDGPEIINGVDNLLTLITAMQCETEDGPLPDDFPVAIAPLKSARWHAPDFMEVVIDTAVLGDAPLQRIHEAHEFCDQIAALVITPPIIEL
jgi:hypothetical protein